MHSINTKCSFCIGITGFDVDNIIDMFRMLAKSTARNVHITFHFNVHSSALKFPLLTYTHALSFLLTTLVNNLFFEACEIALFTVGKNSLLVN